MLRIPGPLAAIAFLLPVLQGAEPVVEISTGALRGANQGVVHAFLGVPFAAPPLGGNRWRPPQPAAAWQGVRGALTFSPGCAQVDREGHISGSEDCLYLNVWTPANRAADAALPVLFFMHGGGNMQGSAGMGRLGYSVYDGAALAGRGGVVVVTIQYRLGAFGFLAHPGLSAETEYHGSGNYGLLDQIAALQWVQREIAKFGGDPRRVMLFGESAGALDTCALMASPQAAGLFSRALMQSGGGRSAPLTQREKEGLDLAAKAGCKTVECLRAAPVKRILEAADEMPATSTGRVTLKFGPTVDGFVLPLAPLDAFAQGKHNRVPLIIGANADETAAFNIPPMTQKMYERVVFSMLGWELGEQALAIYSAQEFGSPREALIQLTTDSQFVCPSRTIASTLAATQSEPVYRYFYTHELGGLYAAKGAAHGLELIFVFQHLDQLPLYRVRAEDQKIEDAILHAWTAFAVSGDPNTGSALPSWPAWRPETDPYFEFGAQLGTQQGLRTERCDFWQRAAESRKQ